VPKLELRLEALDIAEFRVHSGTSIYLRMGCSISDVAWNFNNKNEYKKYRFGKSFNIFLFSDKNNFIQGSKITNMFDFRI